MCLEKVARFLALSRKVLGNQRQRFVVLSIFLISFARLLNVEMSLDVSIVHIEFCVVFLVL